MTATAILALLSGVLTAAPQLMALFQKAQAGGTVTEADVQSALSDFKAAHAQLDADIKAAGG